MTNMREHFVRLAKFSNEKFMTIWRLFEIFGKEYALMISEIICRVFSSSICKYLSLSVVSGRVYERNRMTNFLSMSYMTPAWSYRSILNRQINKNYLKLILMIIGVNK